MTLISGGSSYRSGWVTSPGIKASRSSRGSLFHAFSGSLEEKEIEIDGSGRHLGSFFPWWLGPTYQGEMTSWDAIYQVIHLLSFLLWEHVRSLGLSSNDSYGVSSDFWFVYLLFLHLYCNFPSLLSSQSFPYSCFLTPIPSSFCPKKKNNKKI